jgi:hypothetical protein
MRRDNRASHNSISRLLLLLPQSWRHTGVMCAAECNRNTVHQYFQCLCHAVQCRGSTVQLFLLLLFLRLLLLPMLLLLGQGLQSLPQQQRRPFRCASRCSSRRPTSTC